MWSRIHAILRSKLRELEGRDPELSAGIIDSQTVKTIEKGGIKGYDAGEKINGRKRQVSCDSGGKTSPGCQKRLQVKTSISIPNWQSVATNRAALLAKPPK